MPYYDGFVIAVPTANKQKFIDHANKGDSVFMDFGATRVVETWGDNVPKGHTTDFQGAVEAQDEESVVFSWIEWPDKATRDAGMGRMMAPDFQDDRMDPEKNPMPFDGKRLIFGGFQPMVELGKASNGDYVQGFLIPVPENRKDDYARLETESWPFFEKYGATSVVAAWGDDVPEGKQTDFYRAVKAESGENVAFAWMTWPDRATCDAAAAKMMDDPGMKMPEDMPFNGKRMVYGGFQPVVVLGGES
ncbi:DUF1428 domain-containing protein [Leptolyngbya sp. 15MV]|nr:DUF1428 domain-containing protein [Leptolyngbya sp. 15MV]